MFFFHISCVLFIYATGSGAVSSTATFEKNFFGLSVTPNSRQKVIIQHIISCPERQKKLGKPLRTRERIAPCQSKEFGTERPTVAPISPPQEASQEVSSVAPSLKHAGIFPRDRSLNRPV